MSNTVINTNVMALNSHRALTSVGLRQARSSERLSSGMRINRASDDAAGLAISEKMRAQIRGLDQAERNSQDGISLVQVAEGAMQEIHDIVQRVRELTVQAANDTLDGEDRAAIALEVDALFEEVEDIIARTEFNGIPLFDGTDRPEADGNEGFFVINIQNGANADNRLELNLPDFADGGGPLRELLDDRDNFDFDDTTDHSDITTLLDDLDAALNDVSMSRAHLGASQNRLEHTINNLQIASENTSAAESRIRDTDMAREMMAHTQANVLQQASVSMLAQANQAPQAILQLLQ